MSGLSHLYTLRASCCMELEGDDLSLSEKADWQTDLATLLTWIEDDRRGRLAPMNSLRGSLRLSCEWHARRVQGISVYWIGATAGAVMIEQLLEELPAYGPEIVWAISRGCRTTFFDRDLEPDASYAWLVGSGGISAHERLAVRARAIANIESNAGDSYDFSFEEILHGE